MWSVTQHRQVQSVKKPTAQFRTMSSWGEFPHVAIVRPMPRSIYIYILWDIYIYIMIYIYNDIYIYYNYIYTIYIHNYIIYIYTYITILYIYVHTYYKQHILYIYTVYTQITFPSPFPQLGCWDLRARILIGQDHLETTATRCWNAMEIGEVNIGDLINMFFV